MAFEPNKMTLAQGIAKVADARQKSGLKADSGILTSKDKAAQSALKLLAVTNVPDGFTKYQLPIAFDGPTLTYLSHGAPNTRVPSHSHNEGAGIRLIVAGSIRYKETELMAGDWMYIPKGAAYEFEVGPLGMIAFYCYQCCCA
jgi:hypothetical protein